MPLTACWTFANLRGLVIDTITNSEAVGLVPASSTKLKNMLSLGSRFQKCPPPAPPAPFAFYSLPPRS
ncbi:hypothetical protein PtB15_3B781 [Puccinia triticina]|nr:hypothetical protein PtB15_3B781 [Puccinia triticina]